MNGWKPIETAPRDGTKVDLWDVDGFRWTNKLWGEHYWLNGRPTHPPSWGPPEGDQWNSMKDIDPTHWMPLPEPPE